MLTKGTSCQSDRTACVVVTGTNDYTLPDTQLARGATTLQVAVAMHAASLESGESCGFSISSDGGVTFTSVTAVQATRANMSPGAATQQVVSSGGRIVVRVVTKVRSKYDECYLDSLTVTGLKASTVVGAAGSDRRVLGDINSNNNDDGSIDESADGSVAASLVMVVGAVGVFAVVTVAAAAASKKSKQQQQQPLLVEPVMEPESSFFAVKVHA